MQLDPGVVRAFSTQVSEAATSISDTRLGDEVAESCAALSGSTSQYAARLVGAYISGLVTDYSANVATMGASVRSAGDALVVQDETVKADLDKAWVEH